MKKVLVVDDEKIIVENICAYLEKNNYEAIKAYDGEEALTKFEKESPSMIILDLMLPKIMGEEVCTEIRRKSAIPIIMLTAKISEENKIIGLNVGADDYIEKPFSLNELMARVNSLFRRVHNFSDTNFVSFNNGDLKINYDECIVMKQDSNCNLTKSERNILFSLSQFPKKVFTRDEIIKIALGDDFLGFDRAIDSHIKNLRRKIEDNTQTPKYIVTVRGVGYKFGGAVN